MLPFAELGTVKVSTKVPVGPVVDSAGIDNTPAVAATATGTLGSATLFESSAATVIVVVLPAATVVGAAEMLIEAACAGATTATCTCAVKPPTVAVTVIVRNDGSPAVDNAAVAVPDASVVVELAVTGAMPPDDALNATAMLGNKFPFASFTNAVSFAAVVPSDNIA